MAPFGVYRSKAMNIAFLGLGGMGGGMDALGGMGLGGIMQ